MLNESIEPEDAGIIHQSGIQQSTIALLLYGRSAAKLGGDLADGFCKRPVERATAGAFVTSAAKALGDAGYIEFALAAQAHAIPSVGQFAEERSDFDSSDRKNVIQ